MSLSHLKLWINNQSTPSGENAGLNKNHNFFTPWPSHDAVVCVDNRRQVCCEHMEGAGAGVHRCCGRWKGLWSCVSPNPSDFRTIPCLRGFAVQCVAHRVVARRRDFRWFPGDLGSLHTVSAVRLHDNASTVPWGGALGCRLSLKTAILKKPKSHVVER